MSMFSDKGANLPSAFASGIWNCSCSWDLLEIQGEGFQSQHPLRHYWDVFCYSHFGFLWSVIVSLAANSQEFVVMVWGNDSGKLVTGDMQLWQETGAMCSCLPESLPLRAALILAGARSQESSCFRHHLLHSLCPFKTQTQLVAVVAAFMWKSPRPHQACPDFHTLKLLGSDPAFV